MGKNNSGANELNWEYDEFVQTGKDYSDPLEVEQYDPSHANFRDIKAEAQGVLDMLLLPDSATLLDIGSGSGVFALEASKRLSYVYAADVSQEMIRLARSKAIALGINNLDFIHNGFLGVDKELTSVDVITSTYAFHHLPDYWKGVAFNRLHAMLPKGGKLFIRDVVYPSVGSIELVNDFILKQERLGGDFLKEDAIGHFRDEFSTYDWVIEGLAERAGFDLLEKIVEEELLVSYVWKRLK